MPKVTGERGGTQGSLPLYAIGAPRAVLPGPPSVRHFRKPQYGEPQPRSAEKAPFRQTPRRFAFRQHRGSSRNTGRSFEEQPLSRQVRASVRAKGRAMQTAHGFGAGRSPSSPQAHRRILPQGAFSSPPRGYSPDAGNASPQWEPMRLLQSPMPTVISASFVLSGESVIYSRFARNRIPAYSSLFRSAAGMLL